MSSNLTVEKAMRILESYQTVSHDCVPEWLFELVSQYQSELKRDDPESFWRLVDTKPVIAFIEAADAKALTLDNDAIDFIHEIRLHCEHWYDLVSQKVDRHLKFAISERQKAELHLDPSFQQYSLALKSLQIVIDVLPTAYSSDSVAMAVVELIRSKSNKKQKGDLVNGGNIRAPIDGRDACLLFHCLAKIGMRPISVSDLDRVAGALTGYSYHTAREARSNLNSIRGLLEAKLLIEDCLSAIDKELEQMRSKTP